jgi:membrane protease YdiL (CAAX protease family)
VEPWGVVTLWSSGVSVPQALLATRLIGSLACIGIVALCCVSIRADVRAELTLQQMPRTVFRSLIVALVTLVLSTAVLFAMNRLARPFPANARAVTEAAAVHSAGAEGLTTLIIAMLLVHALAEEALFRAVLTRSVERATGSQIVAVCASAIAFGWAHYMNDELGHAMNALLGGVVLSVVYVKTRSLLTVWFAHVIHNAVRLAMP